MFTKYWGFLSDAFSSRDVVLTLFGTLLGALIGWGFSHIYYVKSLADARESSREQERVNELLFRGIENIGSVKYSRDKLGRVEGVVIELEAHGLANSSASAELTVVNK